MDAKRLVEIRARCEAATKGPWMVWDSCSWRRIGKTDQSDGPIVYPTNCSDGHPDMGGKREDLELMAHSRQDIPDLLQALDERDAKIQRMRKALGKIMDEHDHTCQEINGPCLHCIAQKALSDDGEGE